MTAAEGSEPNSVPLRWRGQPDGTSRGSVTQYLRDWLRERPQGATRDELEQAASQGFAHRVSSSARGISRLIGRMMRRGEFVEKDGRVIYHRPPVRRF